MYEDKARDYSENEELNTITYDEGWQRVSEREYADYSEEENNEALPLEKKRERTHTKQLLITIQLIICLLIALAAFVIKAIGGDFYETIRNFYQDSLNNSAVFETDGGFDLGDMFGAATKDEAEN